MADNHTHILSTYSEKEQGSKWARRAAGAYIFHWMKLGRVEINDSGLVRLGDQILTDLDNLDPRIRVGDTVIVVADKGLPCWSYICIQILQRRFHETVRVRVNALGITQDVPFVEKLYGCV